MPPRESTIQRSIINWLRTVPNCQVRNLHGSPRSTVGDPDIYGCINGRMFHIEVKQPGEEPRPIQSQRLREWERSGAIVGVAHSLDEAKELLAPILPSSQPAPLSEAHWPELPDISDWSIMCCYIWLKDNDMPVPIVRDYNDYNDRSIWLDAVLSAMEELGDPS